jgi:hypothetical protein
VKVENSCGGTVLNRETKGETKKTKEMETAIETVIKNTSKLFESTLRT